MPDQLQQHADRIHAQLPADGSYNQHTLVLVHELDDAILADPAAAALVAGAQPWQQRRFAELAVTCWRLGYPPIRDAIRRAHQAGYYLRAAPTRVQAGFATRSMTERG